MATTATDPNAEDGHAPPERGSSEETFIGFAARAIWVGAVLCPLACGVMVYLAGAVFVIAQVITGDISVDLSSIASAPGFILFFPLYVLLFGFVPGLLAALVLVAFRWLLGPLHIVVALAIVSALAWLISALIADLARTMIVQFAVALPAWLALLNAKRLSLRGFFEPRRFDWRRPRDTDRNRSAGED